MELQLADTVHFEYPHTFINVVTYTQDVMGLITEIFFEDNHSVVVARYCDIEAAVIGHHAFCQRDVARFIVENHLGSL
jgi:hypothetical protein